MSSYDQNLLDEAPKATRAQLQEGYSVDLLEQRTSSSRLPPPHSQSPQPAPVSVPLTPGAAETGSGEKLGSTEYTPAAATPRTSFWRTRNGIITIVVIVLAVIAAVVGGAVGGTVKKSNNNSVGRTGSDTTSSVPSSPSSPSPVASTASAASPLETTQAVGGGETTTVKPLNTTTRNPVPATTQKGQNTGGGTTTAAAAATMF